MYHYVYKIEISGTKLYYFGKRSCRKSPLEDVYLGSGRKLFNFPNYEKIKTIISEHTSSDEAYAQEKIILGDLWKTDDNCLNAKPGGKGAPAGENHHWYGKKTAYTKRGNEHHAFGKCRDKDTVAKISMGQKRRNKDTFCRGKDHPNFGKPRADSVKSKISNALLGVARGTFDTAHKQKISSSLAGKHKTAAHRAKISEAMRGKKRAPKPPVIRTCPFCLKSMDAGNYSRYHGNRCKLNPRQPPKTS